MVICLLVHVLARFSGEAAKSPTLACRVVSAKAFLLPNEGSFCSCAAQEEGTPGPARLKTEAEDLRVGFLARLRFLNEPPSFMIEPPTALEARSYREVLLLSMLLSVRDDVHNEHGRSGTRTD